MIKAPNQRAPALPVQPVSLLLVHASITHLHNGRSPLMVLNMYIDVALIWRG
jgi:hypothetical protein